MTIQLYFLLLNQYHFMKYLRKIWVRLLISVIVGGVLAEAFHYRTGNNDPQISNTLVLMGSVVTFILLSAIVWATVFLAYLFPNWFAEEELDQDILDKEI